MNTKKLKKEISERFAYLREAFDPSAKEFIKLLEKRKIEVDDLIYFLLKIIAEFERVSFETFKENYDSSDKKCVNPNNTFSNLCARYWHLERYLHMELSQVYENMTKWMKDAKSSADGSKAKEKSKRS